MNWILLSLAAALIWAFVNVVDKFFLTKWVKEPVVMTANVALVSILISLVIFISKGFPSMPQIDIVLSLLVGILYILGNFTYMKAMETEDVSKVVPLMYTDPFFTTAFAVLFLGERLGLIQYAGIILLILGAMLISTEKLKFKFNKATGYALLTAILFSTGSILMKPPLSHADFWTVFAYTRLGVFIGMLLLLPSGFKSFYIAFKNLGLKISLVAFNESLSVFGTMLFMMAVSIGYVSLANALTATQPLFAFILAIVISLFFPHIFKEEINKRIFIVKFISIAMILAGTILILYKICGLDKMLIYIQTNIRDCVFYFISGFHGLVLKQPGQNLI